MCSRLGMEPLKTGGVFRCSRRVSITLQEYSTVVTCTPLSLTVVIVLGLNLCVLDACLEGVIIFRHLCYLVVVVSMHIQNKHYIILVTEYPQCYCKFVFVKLLRTY